MDRLSLPIRLKLAAAVVLLIAGGVAALVTSPRRTDVATEQNCLAQAVYFEARGEPLAGQFAVAAVVLNRVAHPAYPNTVCAVVFDGSSRRDACQFSFACDGRADRPVPGPAWHRSLRVAGQVLAGLRPDLTGRATHYHAETVDPAWAATLAYTLTIGGHRFYHARRTAHASF
ncbi:MAG: cell wall hydrolase [Alphaproteobacteria bacterium]|nr:cell wall hydrolase [Alphaproteobacteria bacterium]